MTVSPLLTVFGFLSGRAATVGTGDVFFLLGLGLHLIFLLAGPAATSEVDAVDKDILKVTLFTHNFQFLMVE